MGVLSGVHCVVAGEGELVIILGSKTAIVWQGGGKWFVEKEAAYLSAAYGALFVKYVLDACARPITERRLARWLIWRDKRMAEMEVAHG